MASTKRKTASSKSISQTPPITRMRRLEVPDLMESDSSEATSLVLDATESSDPVASSADVIHPNSRVIAKPKGAIWEHITRSDDNGGVTLSCNYCKKKWLYTEEEFKKKGSSTGNQMKHLKNMHKTKLQGNAILGPMDSFVTKASQIQSKFATDPKVSDELLREAIENFVLSEIEPFTIVESEPFLTLLKLCLKCRRDNVFLPKADALRNGIMKRTENMREELKKLMANDNTAVHLCLDMWTSSNQFSFLAITAHYIDDCWTLQ